ncbi:MAG TPA: carboxypeptidase-like regulatory domain-containing protein [Vicinamibacterales bacterium]|nr:carboxypeptidase-like regulatory domain-containing protein [Vicinamibacterales bacterium]
MRTISRLVLFAAALVAGAAAPSGAQTFTGGLRGEVRDPSGVLPGAAVTLINEETGVSRETTTNEVGQYSFPAVVPGVYTIRVSLPGYKTYETKGLRIGTQQFVTLDVTLEVGAIQETITVTGQSPLIETSTASTGSVLDRKVLESLPAPGRAAYLMAVSVPTVVATGDAQFNRQQDQTNASLLSLGGGPRRGNNYLLDGLPITDMRNRSVINPIIEAVDEVKVQVHTYDTEMGRTGGGIFNVTMKSGTNDYRGTGFYQTRPTRLLEQNFFLKRQGIPKPDQYYRLYGTGIGGPIVRNRTFFWSAAEGYRSLTTRNGDHRFPTSLERQGDFSRSPVIIYDPLTTDAQGNRQPFPGNRIPQNRINPVAAAILRYLPMPDEDVNVGNINYRRQTQIVDAADQITGKIEHKFTDKVSLSGVYVYNKTDEPHSVFWDDNLFGSPSWLLRRRIHVVVVNNTWLPNDTTVVTFRGGWNRFDDNCSVPHPFDPGTLGFNQAFVNSIQFKKFPRINMTDGDYGGPDGFMGWCPRNDIQWYTHAYNGTITKLVGRHSIKMGAEFQFKGLNTQIWGQSSGVFNFSRLFTASNHTNPAPNTGDAIASLLLGYPDSGSATISNPTEVFFRYYGGFIQDDFRVSSRLTLTYGLRLEREEGLQEKEDRMVVAFDENAVSPLDAVMQARKAGTPLQGRTLRGGLVYAGQNGAPRHQGDPPAIKPAPRVGVVYAINTSTVLRGGYGLFWAPWNYPFPSEENYGQRGYSQVTTLQQTTPRPTTTLDNPFPRGLDPVTGNSAGLMTGVGGTVRFIDQRKKAPYVHQWSVDVQRELPGNMAVTIGYIGSRGEQLGLGGTVDSAININQLDPALMAMGPALLERVPNPFFGVPEAGGLALLPTIERGQLLRPFPQFRDVLALQVTKGKSRYHALVLQLDKRVSQGWGGRFSYTLSRLKDNQFGESNFYTGRPGLPQNNYDLEREFSLGLLDMPHKVSLAPIVEFPFGQGRRFLNQGGLLDAIFGGWSFSAIVTFESGFPIGIGQTSNNQFGSTAISGNIAQRPNVVPGQRGVRPGNITDRLKRDLADNQYLNPDAWSPAPAFTFGNAPRTSGDVRSPFRTNWDVVFNKSFRTGGTTRLDARFEILNALNQPKYAGFRSISLGSPVFGRVATQAGFMRIWQISLRFAF